MKLKKVGFFCELKHGDPSGPSLKNAVQSVAHYDKDCIVKYIRSSILIIGSPGVVRDVLDPAAPAIGASNILTDGEWAWPEDLAHYVSKYNVDLPRDFIKTLQSRAYQPPSRNSFDLRQFQL